MSRMGCSRQDTVADLFALSIVLSASKKTQENQKSEFRIDDTKNKTIPVLMIRSSFKVATTFYTHGIMDSYWI